MDTNNETPKRRLEDVTQAATIDWAAPGAPAVPAPATARPQGATVTNEQITAGAAVKADNGQAIGRNAAIEVWDAMHAAAAAPPTQAQNGAELDLQQLKALALAAKNLPDTIQPFVSNNTQQVVVATHSLDRAQMDTVAGFYDAASPAVVLGLIARIERQDSLLSEGRAVFDLMVDGCREPNFGDFQNGHGETIGPRMDELHAKLRGARIESTTAHAQPVNTSSERVENAAGNEQVESAAALKSPMSPEIKAAIEEAHRTGATSALATTGEAVFINYGHDLGDNAHLECTACGGSGHIEDQKLIAERAAAPASTVKGHTASEWYVNYCEVSEKLKAAEGCIARYQRELEQARAGAPATASGDERADFEAWHRSKFETKYSTGQPTRDMHNGVYAENYGPKHPQLMWEAYQAGAAVSAATKPTADLSSFDADHFKQLLRDVSNESYFCGINFDNDEAYAGHFALAESADKAIIDYVQSLLATKPAAAPAVPEGFVLVPANVTPEMQRAYFAVIDKNMPKVTTSPTFGRWDSMREAYRAMLAATPAASTPAAPALPVELMGVREEIEAGSGFWRACSGCYETEDGYPVGHYPHSDILGCTLGGGCSECGGIGAVWDNNDYEAMGRDWEASEAASTTGAAQTAEQVREQALEQTMIEKRIELIPEYEGEWRANVYRDSDEPQATGTGHTPSAAVECALRSTPTHSSEAGDA